MRSFNSKYPQDIIAGVAILAIGVCLEVFFGDDHFQRSGSLLVVLALVVALLKNKRAEVAKLESEIKSQLLSTEQHEHYRACSRKDLHSLIVPIYNPVLVLMNFMAKLSSLETGKDNADIRSNLEEVIRQSEEISTEHLSEKELVDNLEARSAESIKNDWEKEFSEKTIASRVAAVDYFRESCIAALGTIVWGYGDIFFCVIRALTPVIGS